MSDARPIGIFDSGIGGLTVMRAVRARLPGERIVYLGDTARLPYGTKSAETVTRYAVQAAGALMRHGVKAVIVACNTASAVALPALSAALDPVPVLGVVEPGARAAAAASPTGRIAVLATEGTVRGGAYVRALHALAPHAEVTQQAASVLVALAEEGWTDNAAAQAAADLYVRPLFAGPDPRPDTLVLGCTHFPVLAPAIARAAGPGVTLVDSAAAAAEEAALLLARTGLARSGGAAEAPVFLATDAPERFARVGGLFLGADIAPAQVRLVDLR